MEPVERNNQTQLDASIAIDIVVLYFSFDKQRIVIFNISEFNFLEMFFMLSHFIKMCYDSWLKNCVNEFICNELIHS